MSYSGNTPDDLRGALICVNTDPSDPPSGTEVRALGDSDGRQIVDNLNPKTPVQLTADGQVKASAGTLFGFVISFSGATIGDKVEIRDALGAGAGTVIFTIVAATADETHSFVFEKGMIFATGIYNDETKAGGGTINATYIYE